MTNIVTIKARLRSLLEDNDAQRFSDELLSAALHQALEEINQRLPRILNTEVALTEDGRDQTLSTISGCRYLISLTLLQANGAARELAAGCSFTYRLQDGTPALHFLGSAIPRAGDRLHLSYASGYTIAGFEDQALTTLPEMLTMALVSGAAAHACLLRAGSLVERYGSNPKDSARMLEIGKLWRGTFERDLNGVKTLQEFGYPPGFVL